MGTLIQICFQNALQGMEEQGHQDQGALNVQLGSSSLQLEILPVLIVQLVKYLLLLEPHPALLAQSTHTTQHQVAPLVNPALVAPMDSPDSGLVVKFTSQFPAHKHLSYPNLMVAGLANCHWVWSLGMPMGWMVSSMVSSFWASIAHLRQPQFRKSKKGLAKDHRFRPNKPVSFFVSESQFLLSFWFSFSLRSLDPDEPSCSSAL